MWLIVGLGNPGAEYKNTRHNIGFLTVESIVDKLEASFTSSSFKGELAKSKDILILKPTTFMNGSGESVAAVKRFYKVDIEKIIVIHDDLDLPFGALKFKKGGGNGGHNGLKSIDEYIGNGYIRVRMGISKPKYKFEVASYVLSPFTLKEREFLPSWIEKAADAALKLTKYELEKVASTYTVKRIEL